MGCPGPGPGVRTVLPVDGASLPPRRGSDHWHSDNSYRAEPAAYTLLYLLDGANGTSTPLCDATRAFETLEPTMRTRIGDARSTARLREYGCGGKPTQLRIFAFGASRFPVFDIV